MNNFSNRFGLEIAHATLFKFFTNIHHTIQQFFENLNIVAFQVSHLEHYKAQKFSLKNGYIDTPNFSLVAALHDFRGNENYY